MGHFLSTLGISIWAFLTWYIAGLGAALYLMPTHQRNYAFLIAPLIGMSLLVLIGLFQLSVLLVPMTPQRTLLVLMGCSIGLAYTQRNYFAQWKPPTGLSPFLVPLLLLFLFAWIFHQDGYELLIGSSDQLQYCQNARQTLEMHTGSVQDWPVPRHDYFIYDIFARTMPYLKHIRHGAEVLLATMMKATGLSAEETFPIVILCAWLTLSLTLAYIAKAFFSFRTDHVLWLQLVFFSSFYFLLIHVQGSLALSLSIALNFVTLAWLVDLSRSPTWRKAFLTALAISASVSIYYEPILIVLLLPTTLWALVLILKQRARSYKALCWLACTYLIACTLAPYLVMSLCHNLLINLNVVMASFSHPPASSDALSFSSLWPVAAVILGAGSYYDQTAINGHIQLWTNQCPWLLIISYFSIGGIALCGLLCSKNTIARLYAIVLLAWLCLSPVLAYEKDYLRFVRSMHYAMPFILLGLSMLIIPWPSTKKIIQKLRVPATVFVSLFVLMNLFTVTRTVHYLVAHNVHTDTILSRFNERAPAWRDFKKELAYSALQHKPVLVSGFKDTIHPVIFSTVMREQTHVLGESILNIWPIYRFRNPYPWTEFNTRLSREAFERAQAAEAPEWRYWGKDLVLQSEQAIMPIGQYYPMEWADSKDIYPTLIKIFANLGQVVYRHQFTIDLPKAMVSALHKGPYGNYRTLLTSGPIQVHAPGDGPFEITLVFEGHVGDVELEEGPSIHLQGKPLGKGSVQIQTTVSQNQIGALALNVKRPVKLHSMDWKKMG